MGIRSSLAVAVFAAVVPFAARAEPPSRWSPRHSHAAVAHGGKLWVMGGSGKRSADAPSEQAWLNDVWSSADGKSWTLAVGAAPWSPREGAVAVSHNGKILLVGGANEARATAPKDEGFFNDVWASANGAEWSALRESRDERSVWTPRANMRIIPWEGGKLALLGGLDRRKVDCECDLKADAWTSADGGKTWLQDGTIEQAGAIHDYGAVELGGHGYVFRPKGVWVSRLGLDDWERLVSPSPWGDRKLFAAVAFGGAIWVMGGMDGADPDAKIAPVHADIWKSADGMEWTRVAERAPWPARCRAAVVAKDGAMWVLGGEGENGPLNDVWRSGDGVSWSEVQSQNP